QAQVADDQRAGGAQHGACLGAGIHSLHETAKLQMPVRPERSHAVAESKDNSLRLRAFGATLRANGVRDTFGASGVQASSPGPAAASAPAAPHRRRGW